MTRERIVIGLSGPAGCGKSTAAAMLERELGFVRVRFAGPLKAMMRALLKEAGIATAEIEDMIEGATKETPNSVLAGKTPRQAMQWLGTEWGRELIGCDFWTGLWSHRTARLPRVVCDDVRFENEAAAIRAAGGIVIGISCPWAGTASGSGHASEAGVAADEVVRNDVLGEPSAFEASIRQIAHSMVAGQ